MLTRFLTSDHGAVTVDWVVMTAGVVGLGLASTAAVRGGVGTLGGNVETSLTGASVAPLRFNHTALSRNFDTDIAGINVIRNGGNDQIAWSSMNGPDGLPGVMVFTDRAGNDAWVNLGPDFTGDLSAMYDGSFSWDINVLSVGGTMLPPGARHLEITGANGVMLTYIPTTAPPVGQWTTYTAPITAGSLRLSNGTLATETQIRAVLANVQSTAFRPEYVNGAETIAFDNIRLQ